MKKYFSDIDTKTFWIAFPLIISNITVPLVGFVDNVVVGNLGSSIYIGAIGLGSIIISYILFSFGFIKSITVGFTSQHSGGRNEKSLLISLYQILLISSFISILIISFREQIIHIALELMNGSDEVKSNSNIYLEYRIWSIPAIFLRDILIGYYIGLQKTRMAMMISIFINILNILLDYYFIYILSFGVEGVAIASVIAEYSIVLFVIFAIFSEKIFSNIKVDINSLFEWNSIKNKVFINFDMFLRSLILMTCFGYFMSASASYGDATLAANTILLNFFFIFSYGIDGFAHASEVLVGNAVGKKNNDLITKSIYSTGKLSIILMILYLIFFMFSNNILVNFITDIDIIKLLTSDYIIYLYLIFIFGTIAFWLDGVFIGAMQTKILRNIMIISGSIFLYVETAYNVGNNDFLWLSFVSFFMARSVLLSIILLKYRKNNHFLS